MNTHLLKNTKKLFAMLMLMIAALIPLGSHANTHNTITAEEIGKMLGITSAEELDILRDVLAQDDGSLDDAFQSLQDAARASTTTGIADDDEATTSDSGTTMNNNASEGTPNTTNSDWMNNWMNPAIINWQLGTGGPVTYNYVTTEGITASVEATSPGAAILAAPNRAPNSGVVIDDGSIENGEMVESVTP